MQLGIVAMNMDINMDISMDINMDTSIHIIMVTDTVTQKIKANYCLKILLALNFF